MVLLKDNIKSAYPGAGPEGHDQAPVIVPPEKPPMSESPPRFLIIGAGSRGYNYAEAVVKASNGLVAAVAEPNDYKRTLLGARFIWGEEPGSEPAEGQSFAHWADFVAYETDRRRRVAEGEQGVPPGVDGAFVCVLDQMHRDVVTALAPLGLHIMCEKPLACSLDDCLDIYRAIRAQTPQTVFSIGHVLRYSPHNIMLRKLLVEDRVIGHLNSVVHTEPVGWWHYTHSYVRGNWRDQGTSGPSLLTKSCHDIDLLLWLLCSPAKAGRGRPHLPATVSSTGGLQYFKRSRKPPAAGAATNCMSCPLGDEGCKYSAKHVYLGPQFRGLAAGNTRWPVSVVLPDIEDYPSAQEKHAALSAVLEQDYDAATADPKEVASRNWYGRCVFESDNNVCDDQFVTMTWDDDDDDDKDGHVEGEGRHYAKQTTFHMTAQTTKQCDRFSHFYGEHGEVYADSFKITVDDFATATTRSYYPKVEDVGHGGGDMGLTRQFVLACDRVKNHAWTAARAQDEVVGCTLDEVLRSHAMVFAAEEARRGNRVLRWDEWWAEAVARHL